MANKQHNTLSSELTTCPSFVFAPADEGWILELPIHVVYTQDGVSLEQEGNSVFIPHYAVEQLFRDMKKHNIAALRHLNKAK